MILFRWARAALNAVESRYRRHCEQLGLLAEYRGISDELVATNDSLLETLTQARNEMQTHLLALACATLANGNKLTLSGDLINSLRGQRYIVNYTPGEADGDVDVSVQVAEETSSPEAGE